MLVDSTMPQWMKDKLGEQPIAPASGEAPTPDPSISDTQPLDPGTPMPQWMRDKIGTPPPLMGTHAITGAHGMPGDIGNTTPYEPNKGALQSKNNEIGSADKYQKLLRGFAKQESGGRYDLVGPPSSQGRALGKYQVTRSELKRLAPKLGISDDPSVYLKSPDAQEKVMEALMKEKISKWGGRIEDIILEHYGGAGAVKSYHNYLEGKPNYFDYVPKNKQGKAKWIGPSHKDYLIGVLSKTGFGDEAKAIRDGRRSGTIINPNDQSAFGQSSNPNKANPNANYAYGMQNQYNTDNPIPKLNIFGSDPKSITNALKSPEYNPNHGGLDNSDQKLSGPIGPAIIVDKILQSPEVQIAHSAEKVAKEEARRETLKTEKAQLINDINKAQMQGASKDSDFVKKRYKRLFDIDQALNPRKKEVYYGSQDVDETVYRQGESNNQRQRRLTAEYNVIGPKINQSQSALVHAQAQLNSGLERIERLRQLYNTGDQSVVTEYNDMIKRVGGILDQTRKLAQAHQENVGRLNTVGHALNEYKVAAKTAKAVDMTALDKFKQFLGDMAKIIPYATDTQSGLPLSYYEKTLGVKPEEVLDSASRALDYTAQLPGDAIRGLNQGISDAAGWGKIDFETPENKLAVGIGELGAFLIPGGGATKIGKAVSSAKSVLGLMYAPSFAKAVATNPKQVAADLSFTTFTDPTTGETRPTTNEEKVLRGLMLTTMAAGLSHAGVEGYRGFTENRLAKSLTENMGFTADEASQIIQYSKSAIKENYINIETIKKMETEARKRGFNGTSQQFKEFVEANRAKNYASGADGTPSEPGKNIYNDFREKVVNSPITKAKIDTQSYFKSLMETADGQKVLAAGDAIKGRIEANRRASSVAGEEVAPQGTPQLARAKEVAPKEVVPEPVKAEIKPVETPIVEIEPPIKKPSIVKSETVVEPRVEAPKPETSTPTVVTKKPVSVTPEPEIGSTPKIDKTGTSQGVLSPDDIQVHASIQPRGLAASSDAIVNPKSKTTAKYAGVKSYIPSQGGKLLVWQRKDGTHFIVDGHHRLEMAQKAGKWYEQDASGNNVEVPRELKVEIKHESEGWTLEKVTAEGALRNLRGNSMSELESVAILRRNGWNIKKLEDAGVSTKGANIHVVNALLTLDDLSFKKALEAKNIGAGSVAGVASVEGLSPAKRIVAIEALDKAGHKTFDQGVRMGQRLNRAPEPVVKQSSDDSLFGDDPEFIELESTLPIQGALEESVRNKISKEHKELLSPIEIKSLLEDENINVEKRKELAAQYGQNRKQTVDRLDTLFATPEFDALIIDQAKQVLHGQLTEDQARNYLVNEVKRRMLGKSESEFMNEVMGIGKKTPESPEIPKGKPIESDQVAPLIDGSVESLKLDSVNPKNFIEGGTKPGSSVPEPAVSDLDDLFGAVSEAKPEYGDTISMHVTNGANPARLDITKKLFIDHIKDRGGSVLAWKISKNFLVGEPNEIIGQTLTSPEDLGVMGQNLRNPKWETLRVFYTKGGVVVGHDALSNRAPGFVNFGGTKKLANRIRQGLTDNEADGYLLMHNHPSGYPDPSPEDVTMTRNVAKAVPGLSGHVVINGTDFVTISPKGEIKEISLTPAQQKAYKEPSVPHKIIGESISGPASVAKIGWELQRDGYAAFIGTSTKLEVMTAVDVPVKYLLDGTSDARQRAMLSRIIRKSGSGDTFLYMSAKDMKVPGMMEKIGKMYEMGLFRDIVDETGKSYRREVGFDAPETLAGRDPDLMIIKEELFKYTDDGLYERFKEKMEPHYANASDKQQFVFDMVARQPDSAPYWKRFLDEMAPDEYAGMSNEKASYIRSIVNLAELSQSARMNLKAVVESAEAKGLLEAGRMDALAEAIITDPRPFTSEEQVAMRYRAEELLTQWRELKSKGASEDKLFPVVDLLDKVTRANKLAGTAMGRSFGLRAFTSPSDILDPAYAVWKKKKLFEDAKTSVDTAELERLRELADKNALSRDELEKQLIELRKKYAELEFVSLAAKKAKPEGQPVAKKSGGAVISRATMAKKAVAMDSYKKLMSKMSVSFGIDPDPQMVKAIGEYLWSVAQDIGDYSIEAIKKHINSDFPELELDEMAHAITEYAGTFKPKKKLTDELEALRQEARDMAGFDSEAESVRIAMEQDIKDKKTLADLQTKFAKGDYGTNKSGSPATKTETQKEIESLRRKIASARTLPERLAKAKIKQAEFESMIQSGKYRAPAAPKTKKVLNATEQELKDQQLAANQAKRDYEAMQETFAEINSLEEQLQKGEYIENAPKEKRQVSQEMLRLKARKRLLEAEVEMEIRRGLPEHFLDKGYRLLTSIALLNPVSRGIDLTSNTLRLADYKWWNSVLSRPIDLLYDWATGTKSVPDTLSKSDWAIIIGNAKATAGTAFESIKHGYHQDAIGKYGADTQSAHDDNLNFGMKLAAYTDVVFSEIYRHEGNFKLARMEAIRMLGESAEKAELDMMRDDILNHLEDYPDIQIQSNDYALYQTLNNSNWVSDIDHSLARSMKGKFAEKWVTNVSKLFLFRFGKVITNLAVDTLSRTAEGVAESGLRMADVRRKTKQALEDKTTYEIPFDQEKKIKELMRKGLIGSAYIAIGATVGYNLFKKLGIGEIKGKGNRSYVDWGDIGQIQGPMAPFMLAFTYKKAHEELPEDQANALFARESSKMLLTSSFTSNAKSLLETIYGGTKWDEYFIRQAVKPITPLRSFAGRFDSGQILDAGHTIERERLPTEWQPRMGNKKGKMVKSDDAWRIFWQEIMYQTPGLRGYLPVKPK